MIFNICIGSKLRELRGDAVFDGEPSVLSGHAMVVVGYDDRRGAFRIQNSWGRNWADGGYGWFSYDFWQRTVGAAYIID